MKMMVRVAAVLLLSAGSAMAQANGAVKDDLFDGTEVFAKNASSVTEITMDPNRLREVDGKDSAKARTTLLNTVHTYSYDSVGQYRMEDVDKFRSKLSTGDWTCSVHTRDMKSGSSTDVCSKRRTDEYYESAIVTVSPKSLTFIHTIRKRGSGGTSGVVVTGDHSYSYGGESMLGLYPSLYPSMNSEIQEAMRQVAALDVPQVEAALRAAMRATESAEGYRGYRMELLPALPKLRAVRPLPALPPVAKP